MNRITINPDRGIGTIHRNLYGHFSEHLGRCVYGGLYVGGDSPIPNVNGMRSDVVEALRAIRVPVLRWPGGCFADEYHWEDGIGPRESRKRMVNTNWGHVVEDNSFGTTSSWSCAASWAARLTSPPTWAPAPCGRWPSGWNT